MAYKSALPALAPLSSQNSAKLAELCEGLDSSSLWWISGYTAASASFKSAAELAVSAPPEAKIKELAVAAEPLTSIVYGSQSGNAERIAMRLFEDLKAAGISARVLRADAYTLKDLKTETSLYIVMSTQGDGDPPEDSRTLVEHILGRRAPQLAQLSYAVLGLGDSSYPKFCLIGKNLDARLAELGATRLQARADVDVDIDAVALPWIALLVEREKLRIKAAPVSSSIAFLPIRESGRLPVKAEAKSSEFAATVLANQRITTAKSHKNIRHIELSLQGSGLRYLPGDALGVQGANSPELVELLIRELQFNGASLVSRSDQSLSAEAWLSQRCDLRKLSRKLIEAHAILAESELLKALLLPENALAYGEQIANMDLLDLLQRYPSKPLKRWDASALIALLRPLTPRLYSIASSQAAVGEEVHLTVAQVKYQLGGRTRVGAISNSLAHANLDAEVRVFIERNERFRLPSDGARDIVMIGPGTGIAPFRSFVQDRVESGARGRNWLFFGNPHFREDFLYQLEWQQALKQGHLHRLDAAFSRDQAEKVYVQHRLLAQAQTIYQWLEGGAHVYVCGEANQMAKDVDASLRQIIAKEKAIDLESAGEYLSQLSSEHRYQRDIY